MQSFEKAGQKTTVAEANLLEVRVAGVRKDCCGRGLIYSDCHLRNGMQQRIHSLTTTLSRGYLKIYRVFS